MIHIHKDRDTGLWHLDQDHGTSDNYDTWDEAMRDAQYLIDTERRAREQRQAAEAQQARRKDRIIQRRMKRLARREGEFV